MSAARRKIIHIDEEKCDGCGQCVPSCAEGALAIVEGKAREADAFDEQAVAARLDERRGNPDPRSAAPADPASLLANWPVQIRLAPVRAPYLQGARLLIAADCVPFAFRDGGPLLRRSGARRGRGDLSSRARDPRARLPDRRARRDARLESAAPGARIPSRPLTVGTISPTMAQVP